MEVKVVIELGDKAADIIKGLTDAVKGLSLQTPQFKAPEAAGEQLKAEAPKVTKKATVKAPKAEPVEAPKIEAETTKEKNNTQNIAPQEEEAPKTEPVEAPAAPEPVKAEPVADVKPAGAKKAAIKMIQAGHRDEVKALISDFAAEGKEAKVDNIPADRLADFVSAVAALGE